jgi:hypothetical protein
MASMIPRHLEVVAGGSQKQRRRRTELPVGEHRAVRAGKAGMAGMAGMAEMVGRGMDSMVERIGAL